jgi:pyruvate,water dikinase
MLTLDFKDEGARQVRLVGGKGHGLARMAQAGIPVAPGFIVTTQAWRDYLDHAGLRAWLSPALSAVPRDSIEALDRCAAQIARRFDDTPMPGAARDAIGRDYARLCAGIGVNELSVAVRSSATAEDSTGTSFAGEYETYIGLRGLAQVELHVRRCWASAFTARALSYAWKNGIDPLTVEMAVVVQKTVRARSSGVMFTVSPVSGDRSRIVIEAAWGLGLSVVGGEVTPDRYVVSKIGGQVLDRVMGDKHIEYLDGHDAHPVEQARRTQPCLDDAQALALAQLGKQLERQLGGPQDIEFAIDSELPAQANIVLLQCRPITVLRAQARDALAAMASSVLQAARGSAAPS